MTDALRKVLPVAAFSQKFIVARPDDHDERPGEGEQHVGDGVGARIAERRDVAARGIADDLHRRGAGAGPHHGAEQHRPVHAQHVGAEQEADHHRHRADDKPGRQHLAADGAQPVIDPGPGAEPDPAINTIRPNSFTMFSAPCGI